jgi:S1-C subfamily serine protease
VERSDWSDEEPFAFRPPLPPEDRVWRHPSELGGTAAPGAAFVAAGGGGRHPSRSRLALAVAASATGALLIVVFATSALTSGGGSAATTVKPSASTFTFAPTTLGVDGLGRPAEGTVHLVAQTPDGEKLASGIVLDARGTIATTAAAVLGATGVVAYLADGTQYEAKLLGVDADSGAAVVRVGARPLAASSGWASTLAMGDTVHTGGASGPTARVDALGVNASTDSGQVLKHLVRLDIDDDAPIAEGTPLLDSHERVVGLCTHGRDDRMYAVPIEIPRAAARSINVHGRVVVPWLGVSGDDGGGTTDGAAVEKVTDGSPANAAGLQPGDTIISMDGQPIGSMAVLALSLRDYDAGAMVDLAYVRNGDLRHAAAVLVERPSNA